MPIRYIWTPLGVQTQSLIALPNRRIWTRQPQYPVGIDRGSALGKKVAASYLFGVAGTRVLPVGISRFPSDITFSGSPAPVTAPGGMALSNVASGGGWQDSYDEWRTDVASAGISIVFGFQQNSYSGSRRIIANFSSSYNWWIQRGSGTAFEVYVNGVGAVTAAWPSDATKHHIWGVNITPAGAVQIFLNGVLVGSGNTTTLTSVDNNLIWLADGDQIGAFSFTHILRGTLSQAEHSSLAANPWQLFAPANSPRFISLGVAGGSTDTTLTPAAASLTITGYAPGVTLTAHQYATPAAGSITLTGSAPGVARTAHQFITPAAGSVTLTGAVPGVSLTAANTLTPAAASLTITGYAPGVALTAHQFITPAAGSVVLTGQLPGVSVSSANTLTPAAAALTITGYAPGLALTAHQFITPAAGSITLTGSAPGVTRTEHQFITPAAGSVVLTGVAPGITLTNGTTLTPDAAAITLTGYAPGLVLTQNLSITPAAAELTITGYAPGLSNSLISPGAGVIVLTGFAPDVVNSSSDGWSAVSTAAAATWTPVVDTHANVWSDVS